MPAAGTVRVIYFIVLQRLQPVIAYNSGRSRRRSGGIHPLLPAHVGSPSLNGGGDGLRYPRLELQANQLIGRVILKLLKKILRMSKIQENGALTCSNFSFSRQNALKCV